jgi:hypothetical protein
MGHMRRMMTRRRMRTTTMTRMLVNSTIGPNCNQTKLTSTMKTRTTMTMRMKMS